MRRYRAAGCPALWKSLIFAVSMVGMTQPLAAHQPHDPVLVLATSPNFVNDHTIFEATDYLSISIGVYLPMKSTDGGITWTPMKDLPNVPASAIEFSPGYSADSTVYIANQQGLFKTTDGGLTWGLLGFSSGVADVVLSPAFVSDNTMLLVTSAGGLYKSSNRGTTWAPISTPSGLTSLVSIMALSPKYATDKTILVGTGSDGIYRSTNDGASWSAVTQGMLLPAISALVFSPAFASDRTAFAGTSGAGVLVSTDGGVTWGATNSGITDLNVTSVAVSPGFARNSTLFVSTAAAGVFNSSNGGSSWTLLPNVRRPLSDQTAAHYRVLVLAQQSASTAVIYLGMFEGLWKSYNRGSSWQYVDTIPANLNREMQLSPTYQQDQTIVGSTYGGGSLWSTDGGATWGFRNTGLLNPYPDALAFSPAFSTDGTVFCGQVIGLQRTTDRGASWVKMQMLGVRTYPRALGVSPGFSQDSTVIIGTDNLGSGNPPTVTYQGHVYSNQGVFLSFDKGNTWVPTGLSGPRINSIAVSPAYPADRTVFAGSPSDGLYKSTDGGMTWTSVVVVPTDNSVPQVAVTPGYATDQTVFATTSHSGVFKSVDGGQTWALLGGTDTINALDFAVSPNYEVDHTLFIGTYQNSLLKSTDGGNSFQPTSIPDNFITAVSISNGYATDKTVAAVGYRGLYKSTDEGTTWTYTGEPARQEQDREGTVTYGGTWKQTNTFSASSSTMAFTSQGGARVVVSFVGNGARWIGPTGPSLGSGVVAVDGAVDSTVSQTTPTSQMQQVIWQKTGLPCTQHTLSITSSTQAGQSTITVDAFDVLRDQCPYF